MTFLTTPSTSRALPNLPIETGQNLLSGSVLRPETQSDGVRMCPRALEVEMTGWEVLGQYLTCRITQHIVAGLSVPLRIPPADPVFDGLTDSDVVDLVDRLEREAVDLNLPWTQITPQVFWAADYIRRRGVLLRAAERAKKMEEMRVRMSKRKAVEVETDDEADDEDAGYATDVV
jgi:hypothetical protein